MNTNQDIDHIVKCFFDNNKDKSEKYNKFVRYNFSGWSPLRYRYLNIIHGDHKNEQLLEKLVTNEKEIHIKPCHYFAIDIDYCESYKSSRGFTVGYVLTKIIDTCWNYADKQNDPDSFENLSLDGFEFDPDSCTVYPSYSS